MTKQTPLLKQQQQSHSAGGVAADANFLESVDVNQVSSVVDLHRSNLLRIQTQELVEACTISPDNQWVKIAGEYMNHVSDLIGGMELADHLSELPPAPFPTRLSDRHTFDFSGLAEALQVEPLSRPFLGLSTPSGNALVLPTFTLRVLLPPSLLEPKDHLRNRYFDKRNRVVWAVARYLELHAAEVGAVHWGYARNDSRRPYLLLIPPTQQGASHIHLEDQVNNTKTKKKKNRQQAQEPALSRTKTLKFRVKLEFGMTMQTFDNWMPSLRLLPNRCNLISGGADTHKDNGLKASQMYNHALTEDAFVDPFDSGDKECDDDDSMKEMAPVIHATCLLAKTWCLQRGLLRAHDGFETEQLLNLLVYLFRTRQANPRMAPTQVLATLWKLLVSTDWLGDIVYSKTNLPQQSSTLRAAPSEAYQQSFEWDVAKHAVLVIPKPGLSDRQTIAACALAAQYAQQTRESPLHETDPPTLLELWQTQYTLGPVLLDSTMKHNYLGRCSASYMRDMVRQARLALDRLHERSAFATLFMQPARFWSRFDLYMRVPLNQFVFGRSKLWGSDRKDLGDYESIARSLIRVLQRALGDRIHSIRLLSTGNGPIKQSTDSVRNSDEYPLQRVITNQSEKKEKKKGTGKLNSPTGSYNIIIAVTVNSDTCYRIVDRGPPADNTEASNEFLKLWGKDKAQLRRFKDGAIVYAVVWDSVIEPGENTQDLSYIRFHNDDKQQGGIIERIIRHILKQHFLSDELSLSECQFALRNIMSAIDGTLQHTATNHISSLNQLTAHRMVLKAFDSLAEFLRTNSAKTIRIEGTSEMTSKLGIPLAIDAVEPLSAALRYADLFPPVPHTDLGAISAPKFEKIAGVIVSDPIEIQIRFGSSSKWPTDLKAIGAAKAAMLVSLVDGIETIKLSGGGKGFEGPIYVTSTYADLGYMGYVFRIRVRADPEIKLLQSLSKPSPEAIHVLNLLSRHHVIAATHHSLVHAVYTSHPSSSGVTRLARRWLSSHLLSGHIPLEALELLVVHVYTDAASSCGPPASVTAGFMRFLWLLAEFDWSKQPLIVDPQGAFDDDALNEINSRFEKIRGAEWSQGPPMFIVSASRTAGEDLDSGMNVRLFTFTEKTPEAVVLLRAKQLARRTHTFLSQCLVNFERNTWSAAFHETANSFRSYSALVRIDADFCLDPVSSSTGSDLGVHLDREGTLVSGFTRSMKLRCKGPKALQRKAYRNLENATGDDVLLEFNPVDHVVRALRANLGPYLLVFYNDLCPEVLAILWRQPRLMPHAFSALNSEYVRPVTPTGWKNDTLVAMHVPDLLRAISHYTRDIVIDYKVLDRGFQVPSAPSAATLSADRKPRSKRKYGSNCDESESDSDSDNE